MKTAILRKPEQGKLEINGGSYTMRRALSGKFSIITRMKEKILVDEGKKPLGKVLDALGGTVAVLPGQGLFIREEGPRRKRLPFVLISLLEKEG